MPGSPAVYFFLLAAIFKCNFDPIRPAVREFASQAKSQAKSAADSVANACRRMSDEVSSMHLRIPRIEVGALPHFSMRGSFNPETGSVPSVAVSWYARGGYFTGPQVVGIGEGRYDEVALPLSPRVLAGIGRGIAEQGTGGERVVNQTFNTRVVRSNEDLYVAADIMNRSAVRAAMGV